MNTVGHAFTNSVIQCWNCPVFDRLFQAISAAAASVYDTFAYICMIVFCVLMAFYIISAVWDNVNPKSGNSSDPFLTKSLQPVFINSLIALIFLGMGVMLPRFVTSVTFEPVAKVTLIYTQSVTQFADVDVDKVVSYNPEPMPDDGFYRPQLRDTIVQLMKTTTGQFQNYLNFSIAIMERAFEWKALLGVGALVRHILVFMIGAFLFYSFFKFFVKFCFYFVDVIIAMTLFAFFFPLSLVLTPFKGAKGAPKWFSSLGKNVGTDQFKNVINSVIGLASAVLTYSVILAIIAKYFAAQGVDSGELTQMILTGDVFKEDISMDNIETLTLGGAVILAYVINYLWNQVPQVTGMVMSALNVSPKNATGEKLANDAMNLASAALDTVRRVGADIISGGEKKSEKSGGGRAKK